MLDLRLPAGLFFAVVGLLLTALGVLNPAGRAPLTAGNVNLYVGLAMVLFGGFLLALTRRKA